MGYMVDGQWVSGELIKADKKGRFIRSDSVFRLNESLEDFIPQAGRFHIYASHACPWANRTLATLALKGLNSVVSYSVVDPLMLDDGWRFSEQYPDPFNHHRLLQDLYLASDPQYTGRVTVPVLWDKHTQKIVCNESSEIIRVLNRAFHPLAQRSIDLYPEAYQADIDALNDRIYESVNNGVYKCGFAQTQTAYLEAITPLFNTLDWLESHLQDRRWLVGEVLTEADLRLFVTLIRFDPVYVSHFKCSKKRIVDYPNLWRHTRDFYRQPGIADTVNITQIKEHYFKSHLQLNPSGIVPEGPDLNYSLES